MRSDPEIDGAGPPPRRSLWRRAAPWRPACVAALLLLAQVPASTPGRATPTIPSDDGLRSRARAGRPRSFEPRAAQDERRPRRASQRRRARRQGGEARHRAGARTRRSALPRPCRGGAGAMAARRGHADGRAAAARDDPAEQPRFPRQHRRPAAGRARRAGLRAGLAHARRRAPGAGRLQGGTAGLRPGRHPRARPRPGHLHGLDHGADRPCPAGAARDEPLARQLCRPGSGEPFAPGVGAHRGGGDGGPARRSHGRAALPRRAGDRCQRPLPARRILRLAARPRPPGRGDIAAGRSHPRRSAAAAPRPGRAGDERPAPRGPCLRSRGALRGQPPARRQRASPRGGSLRARPGARSGARARPRPCQLDRPARAGPTRGSCWKRPKPPGSRRRRSRCAPGCATMASRMLGCRPWPRRASAPRERRRAPNIV